MANKRRVLLTFFAVLAVGTGLGEGSLFPSRYFFDPIFWTGFVISLAIGALVIMNANPSGFTSNRIMKAGAVVWGGMILGALLVSNKFPEAIVFGAGAFGLFVGVGIRGFLFFLFNTRWGYCPSCKETAWIEKKGGKWYCMKRGDAIEAFATAEIRPA
jgi:hypothetical protein